MLLSVHRDFWSRFGFTGKPPREQGEPPHTPHPVPPRSVSLPRGTSGAGAGQTPHATARCRSLPLAEAHGCSGFAFPAPRRTSPPPRRGSVRALLPAAPAVRRGAGLAFWRMFPGLGLGWGRETHLSPRLIAVDVDLGRQADGVCQFPSCESPPPHSLFPFGRESPCTVPVSGWGFSFPSRRGEQRRDLPVWEESFARSSPCGPSYFWEQRCRFHTSASASPLVGRSRVPSAILVVW